MPSDQERDEWVFRVLGFTVPGAPGADAEADGGLGATADAGLGFTVPATPDDSEYAETYHSLREPAEADLAALTKRNPEAAGPIAAMLERAAQHAASGEWVEAINLVDDATNELARVAGQGQAGKAKEAIPQGIVAVMVEKLERSAARWDRAQQAADAASNAFRKELDAVFPAEGAAFGRILDSYADDLRQSIAAGRRAGTSDDARAPVLETVRSLQGELNGDGLLTQLERSGVGVRPAFVSALQEIEDILQS